MKMKIGIQQTTAGLFAQMFPHCSVWLCPRQEAVRNPAEDMHFRKATDEVASQPCRK